MSAAQHIDATVLDQAAAWLVRLNASDVSGEDRADWQRWHDECPQHARAWQRAEVLLIRLGGLPPALTRPVLGRDHDAMRRRVVTRLAALLAVAPVAWGAWRMGPEWTADYRTATGERKEIRLADGSAVMLNTATALDVRFDASQRQLHLLAGEVLIEHSERFTGASTSFPGGFGAGAYARAGYALPCASVRGSNRIDGVAGRGGDTTA